MIKLKSTTLLYYISHLQSNRDAPDVKRFSALIERNPNMIVSSSEEAFRKVGLGIGAYHDVISFFFQFWLREFYNLS